MDKVSIIVPSYNGEKYIRECIDSILTQTYKHLELILVDDGSTDHTAAICDKYAANDGRVKVIHKKNAGAEKARETGIAECTGQYIMFVDSDDFLITNTILEKLVNILQSESISVVCFDYIYEGKKGFTIVEKELMDSKLAIKNMLLLEKLDGNLWCKLYKAEVIKNSKVKFEDKRSCDFMTVASILECSKKVCVVPELGYNYRHVDGSCAHSKTVHPREEEYEEGAYHFLQYIKLMYPEIIREAEYYWMKALLFVCVKMEKSYDVLPRKSGRFRKLKQKVRKNFLKCICNPYLSFREKIEYILCCLNLYRIMYRLFFENRSVLSE